jgi:starvation-inducible outer membrane lipoprotein
VEPGDGDDKTGGRFLAVFPGPSDPAEYTKGRRITAGGQIEGKERMTSGEQDEVCPVIRVMGLYQNDKSRCQMENRLGRRGPRVPSPRAFPGLPDSFFLLRVDT